MKRRSRYCIWPLTFILVYIFTICQAASVPVTLVKDHKSNWNIVQLSDKIQVRFAAQELQKYLARIGDVKIPVIDKSKSDHNIIIGLRADMPAQYRQLLPTAKKGYDGYSVAITPKTIVIAGDNVQGVIYGVYDVLEKMGCRWFYPTQDTNDPEVIPHKADLDINASKWGMASPIQYRIANGDAWFFKMNADTAIKQVDWAMKNRYNAMGWQAQASNSKISLADQYKELTSSGVNAEVQKRGMFIHGPAHAFDQLLNSDTYFKKHPEWFGLRNGKRVPQAFVGAQFCWSNAEARKQFVTNAEALINDAPLIKIFCTVPFDGGVACDCDECRKIGSSNLLMILQGELIESLKITHPGVMVETIGGYGAVPDPPSNLSIINPKQRIIWAQWGRYHGVGYDDAKYDKRNLEAWSRAAKGGLSICNYYADNFAEPWVMGPFSTAMVSDRRYFLKNNISALYVLMWSPGYWWNHSLNGYLAGRAYYDVSIDPYEELGDYALNYYGKDAGPLISAYYKQWAKDVDLAYHVRGGSTERDRAILAEQSVKFINPAIELTKGDKVYAYRVSKVAKLHTLAETITEGHRLHDVIELLRSQGKFTEAGIVLDKARIRSDKIMDMFYALAKLNQGLIDYNEVGGFIKMGIKDWIDDEAKKIAASDRTISGPAKKLSEIEMLPADITK